MNYGPYLTSYFIIMFIDFAYTFLSCEAFLVVLGYNYMYRMYTNI